MKIIFKINFAKKCSLFKLNKSAVKQKSTAAHVCLLMSSAHYASNFGSTARLSMYFCSFADSLQAQLINMGVIPTLVKLLGIHSHNTPLTEMCLIAFGNLAELGEYNLITS